MWLCMLFRFVSNSWSHLSLRSAGMTGMYPHTLQLCHLESCMAAVQLLVVLLMLRAIQTGFGPGSATVAAIATDRGDPVYPINWWGVVLLLGSVWWDLQGRFSQLLGSRYIQRKGSLGRTPGVCVPYRIPHKLKNTMEPIDPTLWIFVFFVLVHTYSRDQESLEGFWQIRGGLWNLGMAQRLGNPPGHPPGYTSQAAASEVGIATGQELHGLCTGAGHSALSEYV